MDCRERYAIACLYVIRDCIKNPNLLTKEERALCCGVICYIVKQLHGLTFSEQEPFVIGAFFKGELTPALSFDNIKLLFKEREDELYEHIKQRDDCLKIVEKLFLIRKERIYEECNSLLPKEVEETDMLNLQSICHMCAPLSQGATLFDEENGPCYVPCESSHQKMYHFLLIFVGGYESSEEKNFLQTVFDVMLKKTFLCNAVEIQKVRRIAMESFLL